MNKIEIEALPAGAEAWVCDMRLDIRHVRVSHTCITLKVDQTLVYYNVEPIDDIMDERFPEQPRAVFWSGHFTNDMMFADRAGAEAWRANRVGEFFRQTSP